METSAVTQAVGTAITNMVGSFSEITGWWFMPYVIGIFAVAVVVGLVAGFFGRNRRRGKRHP